MDLPLWFSWLCYLLLCSCIFSSQKGYTIVHAHSFSEDIQTSNQFYSGAFSNTNNEDETQALGHFGFVSHQTEPVYENKEDMSSVTEDMMQHRPDSGQEQDESSVIPSDRSAQKYEHLNSGYQHPFGLLVKENTQDKTVEGVSFPRIKDFVQFVKVMKSSFLTPGSDPSRYFAARATMENELTSGVSNINGESSAGSLNEGLAYDDSRKNEALTEPANTVFEQSGLDANYQKPSDSLFFPDPVDSTASLISPSVYESQDSGPALYPRYDLTATEHVSSNDGSLASGGFSVKNPDIFTGGLVSQNEDVQSIHYKPSGSLFDRDFYFSSHVTSSPAKSYNKQPQDLSYYSSKTSNIKPLSSENNIQHSQYSYHGGSKHQKPSGGFKFDKDFQGEKISRVTQSDTVSPQKPQSLNSYGKSLYFGASNLPRHDESPAQSAQMHQSSQYVKFTPNRHLFPSIDSVSSSSDRLPQRSISNKGVEVINNPLDPHYQVFNKTQAIRSHLFTVKPSHSHHFGYLGNRTASVSVPSTFITQERTEAKSDPSKQNLVSSIQGPKQMSNNIPTATSGVLDSTQTGISSQISDFYVTSTNLASTSDHKKDFPKSFGNVAMLGKNVISDKDPNDNIYGARNIMGLFSTQQKQDISLNTPTISDTRPGFLQTFIQPIKVQKYHVNQEHGNTVYWPFKLPSLSKVSGSGLSGDFWRNGVNTKRLLPQRRLNMSPPSVNVYMKKSRSHYVRRKMFQSKTHYSPYQQVEDGIDIN